MPRGGKRKGAGAPAGNKNALKHGGRAKVLFGIPLDKKINRVEYRALCLEQLETIKEYEKGRYLGLSEVFNLHYERYKGAVRLNLGGMHNSEKLKKTYKF